MTPPRTSVRAEAARALAPVLQGKASLDATLPTALAALPARDHSLLQALCYGTLRQGPQLETVLGQLLRKPLPARESRTRAALLLGLYQLSEMRVPDHAAVTETVQAVRLLGHSRLTGMVNGVLRNFSRNIQALLDAANRDPVGRYAHPRWLIDAIRQDWPQAHTEILTANNRPGPMTLRINTRRSQREAWLKRAAEADIEALPASTPDTAVNLTSAMDVNALPGFSEGEVSVQDAAAQWAACLLEIEPGMRVLDACAAPGGKTGHLLERAPDNTEVIALDVNQERLARVDQNLRRLGLTAQLVCGDMSRPRDWWDGRLFDRILLDAPCSGSGVIRRHPDIKYLRRASDLPALATRQAELLATAWSLLAPGGQLLYATCSIFHAENHEIIEAFLAEHSEASSLNLPETLGHPCGPGRQILPGEQDMDGFFYTLLRRSSA